VNASKALSAVRVVDLTAGISGAYATKLLADFGADVVIVEGPEPIGSKVDGAFPSRDSELFAHLAAGKRSVVGHPTDATVERLISQADLVVESGAFDDFSPTDVLRRHPSVVVLSLTPYGRTGPWADRPATEFVVQAEGGCIGRRGDRDGTPMQVGGRLTEWATGVFGAVGALAAVRRASTTGHGSHVDCSMLATTAFSSVAPLDVLHLLAGSPPITDIARSVQTPSIEPTADGWVGFVVLTRQQFDDFAAMIGRPELAESDEWADGRYRELQMEAWTEMVHSWTKAHTTDEIIEIASLMRIPVAPVNDAASAFATPYFADRGLFSPAAEGKVSRPVPPFLMDGTRLPLPERTPKRGEHTDQIDDWTARSQGEVDSGPSEVSRPLAGLRILDATAFWAGPCAGHVLALLGADVIHLESPRRPDGGRFMSANAALEQFWEKGPLWISLNQGKQSLSIDLRSDEGKKVLDRLVPQCDVIIENFSPRVFESFGLTTEYIARLSPRTTYIRMPAFGSSGAWRDRVGFAATMEQVTGMAWLTGDAGGPPQVPRGIHDPVAGYIAALAALVSLWIRDSSGRGSSIEVAMVDSALNIIAEALITYAQTGQVMSRDGNRSPHVAPQGVYPCRGTEQWIAISVETLSQWQALRGALGDPAWTSDKRLETPAGRAEMHDRLDDELRRWAGQHDVEQAVECLIAAGIPAGKVVDPRLLATHPQLDALGYYEELEHPLLGTVQIPTLPFRLSDIPRWSRTAAPMLGQHNRAVLKDLLGLDDDEYGELKEKKIIGTRPIGL
jgi:crotonobetainyl-CoA:carnitine CoA-transferase CaiB-like acyl-CoA transferase